MKKIIEFLTQLEINNNADWFHANKQLRQEANLEFEDLIAQLIAKIGEKDESILNNIPSELTFKYNRDTRFSHDKSPYNPSMRAHIGAKGKLPIPVGYYIMIRPCQGSFLGGGLFADMFSDATKMIRDYILEHGDELNKIVEAEGFKKYFSVKGTALKNVPKGYDPDSPYAEWLKYKCLYLEYELSESDLLQDDFVEKATDIFLSMKPFNDFINAALKDFKMPQRP